MTDSKAVQPTQEIFAAFEKWIAQRPKLDYRNYGEESSYRQELRDISAQRRRAKKALAEAQTYPFNAAAMQDALLHSFSGRLKWDGTKFSYCTGQYWPTEYRQAAAIVLEAYCNSVRPKILPVLGSIHTIRDIKAASKAAGFHFFDRDTMSFFKCRIYPELFPTADRVLFITSEQCDPEDPRLYTLRAFALLDGSVSTVGKFQAYVTKEDAISAAIECQKAGE
jgi:hypothetical protein